ncbi:MAG TPA: cell envelope integrity protein TolA [Nitrospira sp.]|nr:cell envelope integrity protein TolA [Nitrospira sp.]
MRSRLCRSVVCFLALACVTHWVTVPPLFSAAPASGSGPRWARFELHQQDSDGDLQTGKPLTLLITLGGVSAGPIPIVALCESILFEPQIMTLEPDDESSTLKAEVTLDPIPASRTSVHQKAARIQVTFARSRPDKLERLMKRIVYVTLGRQEPVSDTSEPPAVRPEEPSTSDLIVEEPQPSGAAVTAGALVEEDLMPLADPSQGKAYWQQVSLLVSRSWARQVRGVRRSPSSETVRVRFKLYPSGRAQLIQIERGSGVREIDEAGIYAVVNAQPFPPLPDEVGDEPIDVHVRMRTGARSKTRDVQSVGNTSNGKPEAPATIKK